MANLAQDGGDPRMSITGDGTARHGSLSGQGVGSFTRPQLLGIRDPSVKFEQYLHYANETRIEQDQITANDPKIGWLGVLWPSKKTQHHDYNTTTSRRDSATLGMGEKNNGEAQPTRITVSDEEWMNAQRAVRQASGAACFYLITTDILGPFGLAYSFATVGWAPGVVLFTMFAVLAGYSGYLEWQMFMWTDSFRYPALTYGDLAYRIYGNAARIPINILQSIQLILTVSLITISNGLALSIVAKFKLCYVVCVVILVVCGMVLGQIRTLQKFGFLANLAVFMNVSIMVLTMAVAAHSAPNYTAAGVLSAGASLGEGITPVNGVYPPVQHTTNIPNTGSFVGALNGIMNTVFAYGGANIFTNFMAEMRRPADFLKAMWISQFFIWFVYMFYGLFLYGYQGQYSISPSPQTVSPYWALAIANILYILSATIAAVLYGNIGLKVIYTNIGVELLKMPPLTQKSGKILWVILIPIYWTLAFVIGAVIPNFNALVGVVGAICIIQFTYSIPPFLYIGAKSMVNAMQPGEGYNPATNTVIRHDTGMKRWVRGFTGGTMFSKLVMFWNVIYFLGALALGGLGAYASITLIIDSFANGSPGLTTFSCTSPLDGQFFSTS
ncbi:hypothetical protein PV11_08662 [Exophiala sideris]|uniref:Amino acid transporter transmembrane domain-containing protein n=1 Tax=Exophiala sideris TaxID=1016849 RepID=A0A0D1VXZ7_9EURO|nr:hypothetical protein PV11_08662 [Exophiala sideris]